MILYRLYSCISICSSLIVKQCEIKLRGLLAARNKKGRAQGHGLAILWLFAALARSLQPTGSLAAGLNHWVLLLPSSAD